MKPLKIKASIISKASKSRPTNSHGSLSLQWLCRSRCRHVHSSLDSFSSHVYLSYTTMLCAEFWCLDHFLSGDISCYVQWPTRSIHFSNEYIQETASRSLILHLSVYVNFVVRMKCVRCIVSLCQEQWFSMFLNLQSPNPHKILYNAVLTQI